MTPEEAAAKAEEFLEEFVLDDAYATKEVAGEERERLIWVQLVEPRPGELHVMFGLESEDFDEPDDPEVQALAKAAIDALRKARPDLGAYRLTWEVLPPP
jgi:hypothetical protein